MLLMMLLDECNYSFFALFNVGIMLLMMLLDDVITLSLLFLM